jgi:hypothetical protein
VELRVRGLAASCDKILILKIFVMQQLLPHPFLVQEFVHPFTRQAFVFVKDFNPKTLGRQMVFSLVSLYFFSVDRFAKSWTDRNLIFSEPL